MCLRNRHSTQQRPQRTVRPGTRTLVGELPADDTPLIGERAGALQWKVAMSTLCQEGTQSAMLCER